MRKRDTVLFSLPVGAAALTICLGVFLAWQNSRFEDSYLSETKANVAQEAELVSAIVTPMLEAGKLAEVRRFCQSFRDDTLRVTVIDAGGAVSADSEEQPDFFDNHSDREEVRVALSGKACSVERYSQSLDQWMIYHAVPIVTKGGTHVLRTAVSTDRVSRTLSLFRLTVLWALLLGGQIVFCLAIYVVKRVRHPLISLQTSVDAIAKGALNTPIVIPENGIMRDLGIGISEMTDQLRSQLVTVTAARNERDLLFETMSEGVMVFGRDGSLLRGNAAAASLMGFSPETQEFNLCRCQVPELLKMSMETFDSGISFEREFVFKRDEVEHWYYVCGGLLSREGQKQLLLTVTDLTRLRRLEAFRTDFVANVSHEIKTPLTCIVGAAEALEDDCSEEQRRKLLGMLNKHTMRLNNLVHDILNLASLEEQQRHGRTFVPVALDGVMANAVNLTTAHGLSAGIAIRATVAGAGMTVSGDAALLEQALVNLIENAIRYSEGTQIRVSVRRDGNHVLLMVQDDGVGIAGCHQERIFERFYRVDKSRSREQGGTGLGLAIVKHIAQLHHGTVELSSQLGAGCLFTMRLPWIPEA